MEISVFTELSLIIVLAAGVAGLMRFFRQPLIIGYIVTGLLVGPLAFDLIRSPETISLFSELGIALLLFMVGIHMSPQVIKEVGKVSLVTGLGQVIFTTLFGFIIARLFSLPIVTSLYIGLALTFSSTIIILKLLSDKRDLERPYGKIAVGFLIVQDVIAALILIIISSFTSSQGLSEVVVETAVRGAFLVTLVILIGISVLPRLSSFFARSQELLFLFSIAWGLGLAVLFGSLGFSIEIGALVAGVALSASPYSVQVAARLKPLRDFFIIIFFILLGTQFVVTSLGDLWLPALVLSAFVLIGNPLIVMILMRWLGYTRRVGFMVGLTVAQVSEFSFIIVLLGVRLGHLEPQVLSLVTFVGLITIAISTYMILYADKLYRHVGSKFSIFAIKPLQPEIADKLHSDEHHAVLFGVNRIGRDFLKLLRKQRRNVLVADFNPDVVADIKAEGFAARYGDADDTEFLGTLPLSTVKMVISTIPEYETNLVLINRVRRVNKKAIIIVLNHSIEETMKLYESGASYVVLPHFLGGQYAARLIEKHRFDTSSYSRERRAHLKDLSERQRQGHEHPAHEAQR